MNIYRVTISDDDPLCGLLAISLVDFPAVEKNFLKFKQDGQQPKRNNLKADEEQRIITGIALLADTPIYRYDPDFGGEYYMVFEKDTIRQLVQKYSHDGLLNVINLQHNADTYSVDSCVMVESYFIDHERGICPAEFTDVPDGSWCVSFKVTDPELWERIKASHGEEGGFNGFSVEVVSGIERKMKADPQPEPNPDPIPTFDEVATDLLAGFNVKQAYRVSRGDIKDAMSKRRQVEITTADGNKTQCQIKDIAKQNGEDAINVYDTKGDKWRTVPLATIDKIHVTDIPFVPWNYDLPSFEAIENDEDNVVTDSIVADRENITLAIKGHYFAMITYDDESGQGCTGMRQVLIAAYGHHSQSGNECFRAYQYFGATHTISPAWKMFLTKRCRSMRIMREAEPWSAVPPQYHMDDVHINIIAQIDDHFLN